MNAQPTQQHGFTLVEMAVVLLIVAMLIGGGLSVVSTQIEAQKFKDTQKALEDAKESLLGYAASHSEVAAPSTHPYLPCPDKTTAPGAGTANDGIEDRTPAGTCVVTIGAEAEGNLPWVTLGINGTDAWGNRIRYRVTQVFANSQTGIRLTNTGTLTVNTLNNLGVTVAAATSVPAVVLSHGPNAWGAISANGQAIPAPPIANVNETQNANADNTFVSNTPVIAGGTGGEFDDIVGWLPASLIFNRMLQSGKLP